LSSITNYDLKLQLKVFCLFSKKL